MWVFDRGIVSEENLALLRRRGAHYLVATPKRKLVAFAQELLQEDWAAVAGRPEIEVKLVERDAELYVLTRSRERAERERTLRLRALHGLRKDLTKLSKAVRTGRLRKRDSGPVTIGALGRALAQRLAVPEESRIERQGTHLALGPQEAAQRLVTTRRLPAKDEPHV